MGRFRLGALAALILCGQAFAHGTHLKFLAPDDGVTVSDHLTVHIEEAERPFPYVQLTVRTSATGAVQWEGLVPRSDSGYTQSIAVSGWERGSYVVEAHFLGDVGEHIQRRSIRVGPMNESAPAQESESGRPTATPHDDQADMPGDNIGDPSSFTGPDQVQNVLADQREGATSFLTADWLKGWKAWKEEVYDDLGLSFGGDYNALIFAATDALPGAESTASSGVIRLYGHWDLIGRGTDDTGGLIFKIEHRHRYGEVAPSDFGPEVGYLGALQTTFSNDGFRTTNLYWRQSFLNQRIVLYAGFLDVTDFVDVYPLASPWTGFNNLVFATGSATIGGLPDGALGVMGAFWLTESLYAVASLADANARATDITEGFNTFLNDFETFKSFELGWAPDRERVLFEKLSVTFWHTDAASTKGTLSGWGVSGSATATIDDTWLVFLRGGWADNGGSIYEGSVSAGFGYQPDPNGSLLGLGLNWGRPNRGTFPGQPDDQLTGELFFRVQVSPNLQVTPSVQVLVDPAANPDDDAIAVFGLRARYAF